MLRQMIVSLMLISSIPRLVFAEQVTCPLIARQSYEELFKAVDTLGRDLKKTFQGCNQDSGDMRALLAAQEQLRASTSTLHQYWQDPALAANDSANFANNLSQAIGSVNSIGETLGNSAIFKSSCGQDKPNAGKLLVTLNDVITNLAPLALLAGTLTGGVAAAIPYVLGVAGVSSIFKILSNNDKNKPDMTNDENRELVARAACEYTRIEQRVRYLTLMQKGELDQLRTELRTRNQELEASLQNEPELLKEVQKYRERTTALESYWRALNSYRERFRKNSSEFESLGDDADLRCGYLRSFANTKNPKAYPMGILNRLRDLGIDANNDKRAAIFYAFTSVDAQVKEKIADIQNDKMKKEDCAALAVKWIRNMGRLIDESGEALRDRQKQMYADLNNKAGYSKWSKRMADVEGQKILLEKLLQFMDAKQDASVVVDRAELNQRLNSLRSMLFGTGDFVSRFTPFGNKSQVAAWLDHTTDLYKDQMREFNKAYESLEKDAWDLLQSLPLSVRQGQYSKNLTLNKLGLIKAENYPKGKPGWKIVCNQLEDAWINWGIAQDYLGNIELFCSVIADSIRNHQNLDPAIVSMCAGKLRLDGTYASLPGHIQLKQSQERPPQLAVAVNKINKQIFLESAYDRAATIKAKQRELSCQSSIPK